MESQQSEKLFYSIGEVAAELGEATSLVRFWSDSFPKVVKPRRTANKNNRIYTAADIRALKVIHYLVKEKGMTLDGARRKMEQEGMEVLDRKAQMLETLKELRGELQTIHDNI